MLLNETNYLILGPACLNYFTVGGALLVCGRSLCRFQLFRIEIVLVEDGRVSSQFKLVDSQQTLECLQTEKQRVTYVHKNTLKRTMERKNVRSEGN